MPSPYLLKHPLLGDVVVTPKPNIISFTARWKNGQVYLNVPSSADSRLIREMLERMAPRLIANRPARLVYHENQTIVLDQLTISIKRQSLFPDKVMGQGRAPSFVIGVGDNYDFDDPSTTMAISTVLCRLARRCAAAVIIPRAKELAGNVGISPLAWSISTGHRTLGRCSSDGFIALSYMLMFLPLHLRDYIIYHELAHLSEMNHSKRFHDLCNQYCNGREKQYINELKKYNWPVLK